MEPSSSETQGPCLEDCLKLLRGERDEQRLAGLLLATKFCRSDDTASILKIYEALGPRFLDRLLMTGTGKAAAGSGSEEDEQAYLQLLVVVLAALCRMPEIASSKDMIKKLPAVLGILSKRLGPPVYEECFEFLFLVAYASEDGLTTLYDSGVLSVMGRRISDLPDGSLAMELSLKILLLVLGKVPHDVMYVEYSSELISVVVTASQQFALLHNALKFDALHLLYALLSSNYAVGLHDALRSMSSGIWATYIGVGVVAILQNRVASSDKLQALTLAESMMSIFGESWILQQMSLPGEDPIPVDRCLLLVLESSRVEVAVILNELAYIRYEASSSSSAAESIPLKQRNLAISFSLLEKIIKLISNACDANVSPISERASMKIINGLNETVGVVLEYLKDAKDHGQKKGDDLLASVRIVGSYLAETPSACKEKIQDLLEYILSIEAENESSPFHSLCFLLPMLCQSTMEVEGCRILASFGGHMAVIGCLVRLIGTNNPMLEDNGTIFLACDTVINILLKRLEIKLHLDVPNIVSLLRAIICWTEGVNDQSIIMMASTLSSLVFEFTSEEALLCHPDFNLSMLHVISQLILRSTDTYDSRKEHDVVKGEWDLHQIITTGYGHWADHFPSVKQTMERGSFSLQF